MRNSFKIFIVIVQRFKKIDTFLLSARSSSKYSQSCLSAALGRNVKGNFCRRMVSTLNSATGRRERRVIVSSHSIFSSAIRVEEDKDDSSTIPCVMEDIPDSVVPPSGPTSFPLNMSMHEPTPM